MADRTPLAPGFAMIPAAAPLTPPSAGPSMPPTAGPAMTLNAWLRWDVVRRVLADLPIHSVLEIGCGQGAVGARLATRYEYVGYEPDPGSYARARLRIEGAAGAEGVRSDGAPIDSAPIGGRGRVHNAPMPARPHRRFDLVCAFEVLEHIEDDQAAVSAWAEWLNPGGVLLVSVPARPDRFGPADEAVGHYRRYDPQTLSELLAEAGLADPELWSYGFPLGYLLEAARNRMAGRGPKGPAADSAADSEPGSAGSAGASRAERTAASGRWGQPPDSVGWVTRWATLPFRLAQRPFTRSGLGTGIIAAGRRRA